jgi:hypothetical protein
MRIQTRNTVSRFEKKICKMNVMYLILHNSAFLADSDESNSRGLLVRAQQLGQGRLVYIDFTLAIERILWKNSTRVY